MVAELDDKMLSLNEAIQECIVQEASRRNMDDVLDNVVGTRRGQGVIHFRSQKTEEYMKETGYERVAPRIRFQM